MTETRAHEGHEPGDRSPLCRACRIADDYQRVRDIGHGYTKLIVRAYVRRFLWSRGHLGAIERARLAGMTIADLIEVIEEARREVTAGRG